MRDLSRFKQRLEETRENLKKRLKAIEGEGYQHVGSEEVDIANYMNEMDSLFREKEESEKTLKRVERALKRFEKGTYGLCVDCGKEISEERLEIVPFAERCIECEKKLNKVGRK
ncbi:MAG: Transcriptional regulator, TraR/DksA family [bacterium 42_11]|nr:MAG: Transcriptional regulator, TraR/DksA family [bacterium 42_11]